MSYRYELRPLQSPWVERGYVEKAGPFVSVNEAGDVSLQRSAVVGYCTIKIYDEEDRECRPTAWEGPAFTGVDEKAVPERVNS